MAAWSERCSLILLALEVWSTSLGKIVGEILDEKGAQKSVWYLKQERIRHPSIVVSSTSVCSSQLLQSTIPVDSPCRYSALYSVPD
ncbi:hypothetical protein Y032_0180g816 [Ancylostoma ceylanicum]|uniref:Secreted protein n=1 Tax=Ancylostoma ceylanicum TaxID=53326 RepID=A0A016STG8_9BILA|nr:hypothetical protein Y032_0180g816 [Ancylostoma ceylanicum]